MNAIAVVTGASSGIGAEFARRLAASHSELWLIGRRIDGLEKIADEITSSNNCKVKLIQLDLSDQSQTEQLATDIANTPGIQTLINNAGYAKDGLFHHMDWRDHEQLQQVHVDTTVRLSHAALQAMYAKRQGQIINVSSVASVLPTPASPLYGPVKNYLKSFSETLALAYREYGIKVQALCPGFTRTDFHQRMGINTEKFYRSSGLLRTLSVEEVVSQSLRDLERGKILSVPGRNYRFLMALLRHMPLALLYRVASSGKRSARYKPSEN